MPNFAHDAPSLDPNASPDVNVSEWVNWHLGQALYQRMLERNAQRSKYLGMSEIGDECMRRVHFHQLGIYEEITEYTRLVAFEMGHTFELSAVEWFRGAGFKIHVQNHEGKQYEFEDYDGAVRGHIDGISLEGPQIPWLGYPCLHEFKAVKAKYWNGIVKHGLKKAEPKYWTQVQEYMEKSGVHNTLFTTINKDTGQMHQSVIRFVAEDAQRAHDRAGNILASLEMKLRPPRISTNRDHFKCKQCGLREYCWSLQT